MQTIETVPTVPTVAARRRSRIGLVAAAPAALAAAVMLHPHDTADAAATLAKVGGDDRLRWSLAHVAEPVAWLAMAVAFGAIAHRLGRGPSGRLIRAGAWLGAVGAAAIALVVYSHGEAYLFMTERGIDVAAMHGLYEQYYEGTPLIGPLALAFQLGMAVLGVGLFRSPAVPRWAGIAVVLTPLLMLAAGGAAPAVSGLIIGIPLVAAFAAVDRASVR